MFLASIGKIPPREWEHRPDLEDEYGNTVATYFAKNGINIP